MVLAALTNGARRERLAREHQRSIWAAAVISDSGLDGFPMLP